MGRARNGPSLAQSHRRLSAFLAGSMLLASGATTQDGVDPAAPLLRAVVQAEDALRQNEPQIAESRYRTALLEGWLLLGALEMHDGDLEAARVAFERATRAAVETRRPRLFLATLALEAGEAAEAVALLRRVIGENSNDVLARRLLARALAADGQLDEAVQELEELRVLAADDLENVYLLATAYLKQQKVEPADSLFGELAKRRPIPQTSVLIGRTYRDFELYDRAKEALADALRKDPEVRRAQYYLGTIELLEHGQAGLDEAMAHFEAELQVAPHDPLTNLYLGMALVEERRHQEAIPHLESARHDPPIEADALRFLGRAYLRLGRAAEAVDVFQRALELAEAGPTAEVDASELHYQLALALRRTGDEEGAGRHFAAAKRSSAHETEEARDRLQRYLDDEIVAPEPEAFATPLVMPELAGLGSQERSELLSGVTRRLAEAYFNLGVLRMRAREFARAGDLFARAAELWPELPRVHRSLGIARFNSGEFSAASGPLSRALDLEPADDSLRRMLALAWFNSGRYAKAAPLLEEDPGRHTTPALQYTYGVALVRSGHPAKAEGVFAELLSEHANWPELNVVLGQALAQQDDYDAAIQSLEKAIELQADVAEAHATLADIYLRQGRMADAEEALRAELALDPEDPRSRYKLAVVLDLAGRSQEAIEIIHALLDETPQHADGRYLLGKILLARGDEEGARVQLEAAARLAPHDPEIHYQLGLALQRLGRLDEARRSFETYQSLKGGREARSHR